MSATAEQITLDSGEINLTPNKSELKTSTLDFQQQDKLSKVQRHIRVYEDKVIEFIEKKGKHEKGFMVNLAMLNETPTHHYSVNLKLIIFSAIAALLTFSAVVLKDIFMKHFASHYIYGGVALLAVITLLLTVSSIRSFRNSWAFSTRGGNVALIELFNNNPDKAYFKQFIGELTNKITTTKTQNNPPGSQMMPALVGEHRRLRDEGILTTEQYELAKANILRSNSG